MRTIRAAKKLRSKKLSCPSDGYGDWEFSHSQIFRPFIHFSSFLVCERPWQSERSAAKLFDKRVYLCSATLFQNIANPHDITSVSFLATVAVNNAPLNIVQ